MSKRLVLVRHGVTESNKRRRYMGRSQEPLCSDGRWQARRLARRLAATPIDRIFSSPLRRARETAAILAQPHRLEVESEPRLNELDLSRWQGMSAAEIAARDATAWETWCDSPELLRAKGIEPFDDIRQRVRRWLERLTRSDADSCTLAVTHDGIIRVIVLEALAMPIEHYRAIPIDNTGLSILEITARRTLLRALNDTGHLAEDSVAVAAAAPTRPPERP